MEHLALVDQQGKYPRLNTDKCGSLWFNRFMIGMKIRMGSIWKPNKGLSIQLLLRLIKKAENMIKTMRKYLIKLGLPDLFLFFLNGFDGLKRIVRSF